MLSLWSWFAQFVPAWKQKPYHVVCLNEQLMKSEDSFLCHFWSLALACICASAGVQLRTKETGDQHCPMTLRKEFTFYFV